MPDPAFPDQEWYDSFYAAVARSSAYSRYCRRVFGRDFSQQGFSDIGQIDFMLDVLRMKPGDRVLDVGCGNGKMVEYVADRTGATGFGFDFSSVAIESARARTAGKDGRLVFETGSIGAKQYDAASFDVVLSVDTLYFSDVAASVADLWRWLKPGGRLAAFFSEFRFAEDDPLDGMLPDGTGLARAFRAGGITYDVFDFTRGHYEHMKLKRRVIAAMKPEFEAEGTMVLFENAFAESIDDAMTFGDFRRFSVRYLYVARKP